MTPSGKAALAAALAGIVVATVAVADTGARAESSEWIVRGGIVAGFVTLEGYTTNGTVGNGQPIPAGPNAGKIDGFLQRTEGDDLTATLELGIGRNFGAWALLLGYQYRYRTDLDVLASTESLNRPSQFHNNIETHVLDLNLIRRFGTLDLWSLRPYVGVGAGIVLNTSDSDFIVRELPGSVPETTTSEENATEDFSWNVQIGATTQIGERWELELRYRFVTLGTVENGPYPDAIAEIETDDGIYSHDILVGVTYRF